MSAVNIFLIASYKSSSIQQYIQIKIDDNAGNGLGHGYKLLPQCSQEPGALRCWYPSLAHLQLHPLIQIWTPKRQQPAGQTLGSKMVLHKPMDDVTVATSTSFIECKSAYMQKLFPFVKIARQERPHQF